MRHRISRRRLLSRATALAGVAIGIGPRRLGWASGPDVGSVVVVDPGGSVQTAIDRAASGGIVHVPAGTFHESLVIEKPLTLSGAGFQSTTVVADRSRFAWSGRPRNRYLVGAINVRDTRDVLIEGLTVRGGLEGVWVSSSTRVAVMDCMSCAHDSSGYYLWGSQDCAVARSEGSECAVGIYQGGSVDIDIVRNVFSRNRGGRVPHLDDDAYPGIGILIGNLSRGCLVTGNLLADNVDWGLGTSLGVHEVTTSANTIRGNRTGVFAGERGLRMRDDNVAGNAEWGVDSAVEVDASEVWWGAVDGPSGAGPGSGDAVTGEVRYRPWRTVPSRLATVGPSASSRARP